MAVHYILNDTKRRQLDQTLESLRPMTTSPPPRRGWLRTIREALGMTNRQLAARLGVNQSRIPRMEQAEAAGAITLKTLREAANAMDCELVYAIVPRRPLRDVVTQRAHQKAEKIVNKVLHSMTLEAQSPSKTSQKEMIEAHAQELLRGPLSRLWGDEKT